MISVDFIFLNPSPSWSASKSSYVSMSYEKSQLFFRYLEFVLWTAGELTAHTIKDVSWLSFGKLSQGLLFTFCCGVRCSSSASATNSYGHSGSSPFVQGVSLPTFGKSLVYQIRHNLRWYTHVIPLGNAVVEERVNPMNLTRHQFAHLISEADRQELLSEFAQCFVCTGNGAQIIRKKRSITSHRLSNRYRRAWLLQ